VNVKDLRIDLLTLSAHKFYGPKGVGALYVRDGVELVSLIHGGNQEKQRRAGTENVPGIVGMALALDLAIKDQIRESTRIKELRDKLLSLLLADIPDMRLNGHPQNRLPNNLNVSFIGIEAEGLLLRLNQSGIDASMGSACTSKSIEPSHVIRAIGVKPDQERGVLRLSLGKSTSIDDVTYTASTIIQIVNEMRN
jgi:cysteine desulfurase